MSSEHFFKPQLNGGVFVTIKIATRRSKLALVQTDIVIDILKNKYIDYFANKYEFDKLLIETEGDKRLDVSLDKIGGKGIFVKDIELALLDGSAAAAVHSMKDVPYELSEEFEIAAMPVREDVRDVFISPDGISFFDLPKGSVIATSSNRRCAQLKSLRPDIETVPIRGNVLTRLEKVKNEGYAGIVLAAAGIKRLGLENIITDYFDPKIFVPAVGQGAIGIEIVKNSVHSELFKGLDDCDIRTAVDAERSFMKRLNGGCYTTVGAYATIEGDLIFITGIFDVNGALIKKSIKGNKKDNIELGTKLAEEILLG